MDNNSIATLLDYQASIERSFKKIEKMLNEFDSSEASQQNLSISNMNKELLNIKNNIGLMRMELSNLHEEENQTKWQGILSNLQSQNESLKKQITEKKNKKNNDLLTANDIDVKKDLSKMTSEEVMKRGNQILDADDNAIKNMLKVTSGDVNTMKAINQDLIAQGEKLDNASNDLKEIDYSIKRAGEQIKTMFRMYATDKLIMCMIIVVILVIIAIMIVSFIKGEDNDDFNTPADIFGSKTKTEVTS